MNNTIEIPRAFVPKKLYAINSNDRKRRIKYVHVTKCGEHSRYPDKVMLEQYYHSNFAVHQITTPKELLKIDMLEMTENAVDLYNKVFKIM